MIVVNFAHPLTPAQLTTIEDLIVRQVVRVAHVRAQFDHNQPLVEQGRALVDAVGLTPEDWQTLSLLVNLPGHSAVAAVVLAELHGRMGYFPAVLRLRPVAGSVPPEFEVAEILNLQSVRDAARHSR